MASRFEACGLLDTSRRHAMSTSASARRLVGETWRLGHWYGGDADLSTLISEIAEERGLVSFRAKPISAQLEEEEETGARWKGAASVGAVVALHVWHAPGCWRCRGLHGSGRLGTATGGLVVIAQQRRALCQRAAGRGLRRLVPPRGKRPLVAVPHCCTFSVKDRRCIRGLRQGGKAGGAAVLPLAGGCAARRRLPRGTGGLGCGAATRAVQPAGLRRPASWAARDCGEERALP